MRVRLAGVMPNSEANLCMSSSCRLATESQGDRGYFSNVPKADRVAIRSEMRPAHRPNSPCRRCPSHGRSIFDLSAASPKNARNALCTSMTSRIDNATPSNVPQCSSETG